MFFFAVFNKFLLRHSFYCCNFFFLLRCQLLPLLDRIDRESLAAQRRVTVPFLRKALGLE